MVGENSLSFGMRYSVPIAPSSLVSSDFTGKVYMLFLPLGSTSTESTGIISDIG